MLKDALVVKVLYFYLSNGLQVVFVEAILYQPVPGSDEVSRKSILSSVIFPMRIREMFHEMHHGIFSLLTARKLSTVAF